MNANLPALAKPALPQIMKEDAGQPAQSVGLPAHPRRFHDVTTVLDRLWVFYEAMHRGVPVTNGDDLLLEMKAALKPTTMLNVPVPSAAPHGAEAFVQPNSAF